MRATLSRPTAPSAAHRANRVTSDRSHCDTRGHDDRPGARRRRRSWSRSALGFAGPASADQVMEGVYTYTQGDVARRVDDLPELRSHGRRPAGQPRAAGGVPAARRADTRRRVSGGDARLTGGQWAFSTDGQGRHHVPGRQHGAHPGDLRVRRRHDDRHAVGGQQRRVRRHRSAAKIVRLAVHAGVQGPLPIPVDQYPLYCDPAASSGAADDEQADRGLGHRLRRQDGDRRDRQAPARSSWSASASAIPRRSAATSARSAGSAPDRPDRHRRRRRADRAGARRAGALRPDRRARRRQHRAHHAVPAGRASTSARRR